MIHFNKNTQGGYTIIEMMVAVSVFLVVLMYGMVALLNSNMLQIRSKDAHSMMDNLSFIMEEISRDLRTGYDYHCIDDNNTSASSPHSCSFGRGISFMPSSDIETERWAYNINGGVLMKSIDGGNSFYPLTSSDISIHEASGFSVLGAEPPPSKGQPLARVFLEGTINSRGGVTTFSLQTTVSQRLLDTPPIIDIGDDGGENE
ncbi:MAG TPA: prepilin-type N-terminal cleavage/methylation domain-containing protein [Candidatus Paceibacterota bacterium]|nr:prepilin-type N-terminal cleavage/methylation domain-containing protein [Candidatus Paceibacterota bacterium]